MMRRVTPRTQAFLSVSLLLGLLAGGSLAAQAVAAPKPPYLAKCSGYDMPDLYEVDTAEFADNRDTIDIWSERYHSTVEQILEDYADAPHLALRCEAESVTGLLQPPDSLIDLASRLPPWEEDSEALQTLSRSDLAAVLQEYLRTYECALEERSLFLALDISKDMFRWHRTLPGGLRDNPVLWFDIFKEYPEQQHKIDGELTSSRATLHRALNLLGGTERLRVLQAEIACLQRLSLDARNAFALGAEAAACLPRIWDVQDPLRDYDQPLPPST